MTKKGYIILAVLVCGIGGYLYYDWHVKTKKAATEPAVKLYSWVDERGAKHFTDKPPPRGTENIQISEGYRSDDPPLVLKIKYKAVMYYKWLKNKLFERKKK